MELPALGERDEVCVDDLGYGDAAPAAEALDRCRHARCQHVDALVKFASRWRNAPLPAMSMFMLCAAPDMAEPIANVRMKKTRTGFRPNADTRFPMSGRTAVEAMVYALPAQMKSIPCRSSTMVGRAVDIAVCGGRAHYELWPRKGKWR